MGCCNGISRHRASPTSSVMIRRLRRLRVTAIFYTCLGLTAILLLVNFNEDVKRLLQQTSSYSNPGPGHLSPSASGSSSHALIAPSQINLHLQHSQQTQFHSSNTNPQQHSSATASARPQPTFQGDDINSNHVITSDDGELVAGSDGVKYFDLPATGPSYLTIDDPEKPWYMWGGTKYPSPLIEGIPISTIDQAKLWHEDNPNSDRIVEQLLFVIDDPINNPNSSLWFEQGETTFLSTSPTPNNVNSGDGGIQLGSNALMKTTFEDDTTLARSTSGITSFMQNESVSNGRRFFNNQRRGKLKNILLYYGLGMSWGSHITNGRSAFLQQKCPVNACRLTGNRAHLSKADVVVFKDVFMNPKVKRNPSQLWVMYMLECPLNTQNFIDKNVFNLTATYRHDSDIVTPYEKWVYYDENVKTLKQAVNYSEGKTKRVAWFVSNCVAKNNRLDYARELSKYIDVDIYGACGTHSCSRANAKQCFDLLAKNYKFYLAFENSNCRDYISEKFFVNGLGNNVLPIVMGAHPDDYKRVAPYKSYIHVDDFASPKELAEYLYLLDSNNDLYNEYFQWKGTGEFINTHFFCRLCAMAHYSEHSVKKPRIYNDFNKWWRGPNVCTRRSWRAQPDIFALDVSDRQTTKA